MEEHCLHEDRWESIHTQLSDMRRDLRRDAAAMWFRWAIPLTMALVLGSYLVLNNRIDAYQRDDAEFRQSSIADRRLLAERQVEVATKQTQQFESIMQELKYLRAKIERQPR